jgi:hypothetical protein
MSQLFIRFCSGLIVRSPAIRRSSATCPSPGKSTDLRRTKSYAEMNRRREVQPQPVFSSRAD